MDKVVIGDATLYHGDCREVLPILPKVECVVTSPPYNQLEGLSVDKLSGIWAIKGKSGISKGQFVDNGYQDGMEEIEYADEQCSLFSQINVADNASLFYNHQIRWRDGKVLHPVKWFDPSGWNLRQEIIWDRCGGMMMNARMFCRFDERVLWFVRGSWVWNQEFVGMGTIWRINKEQNKDHPVAFPVEIPLRCIGATTNIGDTVLDPYSGSATTGLAALTIGRKFIGIERERKYFDIACERISRAQAQVPMFPVSKDIGMSQPSLI
jgi:site-specific DNA-methyltransferase (adenine-specific)